jgi:hypothetical protein
MNKITFIIIYIFILLTQFNMFSNEGICKTPATKVNYDVDSDRPAKENALKQIKQSLSLGDFADITDMQYLNGYRLNTDNYVVIAKYVTTFRISIKEIESKLKQIDTDNQKQGIFSINGIFSFGLRFKYGDAKAGDAYTETTPFQFLKTENGWVLKGEYRENANHSDNNNSSMNFGEFMMMMMD